MKMSFLVLTCLGLTCGCPLIAPAQEIPAKPKLILNADTANEIDDLYAIIRVVRQEKYDLLAVCSAQWFHYYGERESVRASQKLNDDLIRLLGLL